jgi:hypothetical protein
MNRLTKRNSNGGAYMAIADHLSKRDQELEGSKTALEGILAIFQKLAAYEDTGLEPQDVLSSDEMKKINIKLGQLIDYINLEEQGRSIKLPCKVGDTVFYVSGGYIREFEVMEIHIGGTKHKISLSLRDNETCIYWRVYENNLNTNVFLTREKAEKALEAEA